MLGARSVSVPIKLIDDDDGDDAEVVMAQSEINELKSGLYDIKEQLQEININVTKITSTSEYTMIEMSRAFDEIDKLKTVVSELKQNQDRNSSMNKIVYSLISAVFIGSMTAVIANT